MSETNKQPLTAFDFLINKDIAPTRPWFDPNNYYFNVRPIVIEEFADAKTSPLLEEIAQKHQQITILKQANDGYKEENEYYKKRFNELQESISLYKKENEELKALNAQLEIDSNYGDMLLTECENLKSEVVVLESELTSVKEQLADAQKTRKKWYDNWRKILDAVPNTSAGCRDCADENGTCPISKLPCDPTDAVITQFNKLQEQNQKMAEALEEIINHEGMDDEPKKIAKEALLTHKQQNKD